jgi:signal transduction histidine kinase
MSRRIHYRDLLRAEDHTREVQLATQDLLISLADAETGRRGYIVTGDEQYLASEQAAAAKSAAIVRRLTELTRGEPAQQGNTRLLASLVMDRLALLEETARLGREGDDSAVKEREKQSGLAASRDLNKVLSDTAAEESRLLTLQKNATSASDIEADYLVIAGSIATILLLLFAYRIIRQYAASRDRADLRFQQANDELQARVKELDQLNRELEDRVKERTAGLERSNQDLQQFAFFASHDLQEPLRMVASYLELLKKTCQESLDANAQKYMTFALDGAARMQALIRDLLTYAQATSKAPTLTTTKLQDVVGQARYNLLQSIRETGAEITIGPLPELELDSLKMSLVFQNLLSNAIKFRRPGEKPVVHIEACKESSHWRVSVRDAGIGFDPKFAEKIFGAFNRLHGKGDYPGSGIGLAICKRIIEGHGGRIWAEAHVGAGATFQFTLPANADPSKTGATNGVHISPGSEPRSPEPHARASGSSA